MADNEPTYVKVTQLASSTTDSTVGAIFPDSQYLDTITSGFSSSDINGRVASSGLIKQELDKKANLTGATFTGTITTASQDEAIILPNNAMIKTIISDSLRTIYGYDANNDNIIVGSSNTKLLLRGNTTKPKYNGNDLALSSDIFTNQTANYVLASPSESTGVPSFRKLVAADIPSLAAGKITSGTFNTARIPSLDASKITSGTFNVAQIPNLSYFPLTGGALNTNAVITMTGSNPYIGLQETSGTQTQYYLQDYLNEIGLSVGGEWNTKRISLDSNGKVFIPSKSLGDGTYTYTLPNKTGTLATTTDIKNSTITITVNNQNPQTFTLNQSSDTTIDINIPTVLYQHNIHITRTSTTPKVDCYFTVVTTRSTAYTNIFDIFPSGLMQYCPATGRVYNDSTSHIVYYVVKESNTSAWVYYYDFNSGGSAGFASLTSTGTTISDTVFPCTR